MEINKIDKLNRMLELLQRDTVKPEDLNTFISQVGSLLQNTKANFDTSVAKYLDEMKSRSDLVLSENVLIKARQENSLAKINNLEAMMNEICDEVQNLPTPENIDVEQLTKDILSKVPRETPLTGEEILYKINELPYDDVHLIDASRIKNLPTAKGGMSSAGNRLLSRLIDVDLSGVSIVNGKYVLGTGTVPNLDQVILAGNLSSQGIEVGSSIFNGEFTNYLDAGYRYIQTIVASGIIQIGDIDAYLSSGYYLEINGNNQTMNLIINGSVAFGTDSIGQFSSYGGSNPTDGEILIGNTLDGVFNKATLTAGTNVQVTNSNGGITIGALGNGMTLPYVTKTTTYTITANDGVINCTSGTFTVTLPSGAGITGKVYVVKNSGAGTITLSANGTERIDGLASVSLGANKSYIVQAIGSGGYIILASA